MNKSWIKLLNRVGLLKKINVLSFRSVGKNRIRIPVLGGIGLDNVYLTELWMCDLLAYMIPLRKGFFVDVGVNVGQTLIKVRSISEDLPYIGFEPNPQCVSYVNHLIDINHYKNATLVPAGLFDKSTVLPLTLYSASDGDQAASLIDDFRIEKPYKKINVPVFRFKEMAEIFKLNEIGIIKIDVEGAELEVLQSLLETIAVHHPFIFIEILPVYNRENTERFKRQQQIEKIMRQFLYDFIRVHKNTSKDRTEKLEIIEEIGIHGNIDFSDYILVPKTFSGQFRDYFSNRS